MKPPVKGQSIEQQTAAYMGKRILRQKQKREALSPTKQAQADFEQSVGKKWLQTTQSM